jgi:hypothetical protein
MQVGKGEVALCLNVSLVSRTLEPAGRLRITFLNAHSAGISLAQCELRIDVRLGHQATLGQQSQRGDGQ